MKTLLAQGDLIFTHENRGVPEPEYDIEDYRNEEEVDPEWFTVQGSNITKSKVNESNLLSTGYTCKMTVGEFKYDKVLINVNDCAKLPEYGGDCSDLKCDGQYENYTEDCSCHINPPCGSCLESNLECNKCGKVIYMDEEEEEEEYCPCGCGVTLDEQCECSDDQFKSMVS